MFAVDFDGDDVVEWHLTDDGARSHRVTDYTPELYVSGPESVLTDLCRRLRADPTVASVGYERLYPRLDSRERTEVLRVALVAPRGVRRLARRLRDDLLGRVSPGAVRFYNVDLSPGFRYCVQTETPPVPSRRPRTLRLSLPQKSLADGDLSVLSVAGDPVAGDERGVVEVVAETLAEQDPDVLVVNSARLLPLLRDRAAQFELDCPLSRDPNRGLERLARQNTVVSYGTVRHSPARYAVPGRAIVDTGNSFLWAESRLDGLCYLVERSWKPLQEASWASIGNVLTAMQVREAMDRDVLVPWNKRRPETFKSVETLHAADRGGFTFDPVVGLHEDVVELDFASLYPRIICEWNISPDTLGCDCHAGRADIPELDYAICDRRGFLPDVLEPLLADRRRLKREVSEATATGDESAAASARAKSGAIKWVLVSCFGYQGYRNAKFGRIECHEAINAVARDLLLRAKEAAEDAGWRVVHGIVDSLWLAQAYEDPQPPADLAATVTDDCGIPLEVEATYDWVCFVPTRQMDRGALTRYFGRTNGGDYVYKGVEIRQRSTPTFVADAQRDLISTLDRHRGPAAVCDRLVRHRARLRRSDVPTEELLVTSRLSRAPADYDRNTLVAAAGKRSVELGVPREPGQSVRYVVADEDGRDTDRVRLDFERPRADDVDVDYYDRLLIRAAESVVSPLGWNRQRIRRYLSPGRDASLSAFD
ncbi:type B DNA-directed DNA polymerase [Haloferax sp. MBLA0076]|uniref:DNA-directed DNA polymerase n=1 Tax=Haloferax litoreum TaxID=2666140 RepID=A0A6A8GH25_9EURY|nr:MULTISPECIES: type B DNA-directed DNA polymerase [Haloferax]KAB1193930.1 type B DNA-directed DNA polymerase [Haloferax sp. CBA1148]MRX22475.1 type B DNA-directed DNA polymerase [Haloferax litoreum]